jgi:hypothetical protein
MAARKFPQLHDPEWLRDRYLVRRQTMNAMAAELGCSQPAVWVALIRHGITRSPTHCPHCGESLAASPIISKRGERAGEHRRRMETRTFGGSGNRSEKR